MPDYEFYCRRCRQSFDAHMSVDKHDRGVVACPTCKSEQDVTRMIAHVNVQTSRKSAAYR